MKLMALLALACGITAAPLMTAGTASADPGGACDGVDCVPYVDRNIVATDHCVFSSRYPFGLDAKGSTFGCAASNKWVPMAPLIGVRSVQAPCDPNVPASAQSPNGQPLNCQGGAFAFGFTPLYYAPF